MAGTIKTIVVMLAKSYAKAWRTLPQEPGLASGYLVLNAISIIIMMLLMAFAFALPFVAYRAGGGSLAASSAIVMSVLILMMAGGIIPALLATRALFDDLMPEDTKSKC